MVDWGKMNTTFHTTTTLTLLYKHGIYNENILFTVLSYLPKMDKCQLQMKSKILTDKDLDKETLIISHRDKKDFRTKVQYKSTKTNRQYEKKEKRLTRKRNQLRSNKTTVETVQDEQCEQLTVDNTIYITVDNREIYWDEYDSDVSQLSEEMYWDNDDWR